MATPIKFGTSGWRGLIARDFTFDNVRVATQGIALFLQSELQRAGSPIAGRPPVIILGHSPDEMVVDLLTSTVPSETNNTIDLRVPQLGIVGEVYLLDDTHLAEVFGSDHVIVPGLIEHEIEQMVLLGDAERDARPWCEVRTGAAWIVIFKRKDPRDAEHALAILRVTGPTGSSRMLHDLAILLKRPEAGLDLDIAERVGLSTIHPFVDYTTLDITALGAPSKEERFANLFRLLMVLLGSACRLRQVDGIQTMCALVHPRILKNAPEIPHRVPGYGVLDYKIFDHATSAMPTELLVCAAEDLEAISESTAPTHQIVAEMLDRSGFPLGRLRELNVL